MRCPKCTSTSNQVANTRSIYNDTIVRRRRVCLDCRRRFTTYESFHETLESFILNEELQRLKQKMEWLDKLAG